MVSIVSICNMVTFLVALAITFYLARAYLKSKGKLLKYFLYFFISTTFVFLSVSTPFLIFKNTFLISLSIVVMPAFLYISLGLIISISLRILKWQKVEKIYLMLLLLCLVFSYLMIFIRFEPIQIATARNFIYWFVPASRIFWQIGSVATGIISAITLLSVAIFFFMGGLKSEEKFIRKRAFLMSAGMLFLTLAGVMNFIVGAVPSLPAHLTSSIVAVLGLLILFSGIVMIKPTS